MNLDKDRLFDSLTAIIDEGVRTALEDIDFVDRQDVRDIIDDKWDDLDHGLDRDDVLDLIDSRLDDCLDDRVCQEVERVVTWELLRLLKQTTVALGGTNV